MITNTYQALCDDVGASPIVEKCQVAYQACGYYESRDYESCEGCSLFDQDYRSYPPQSAEQRERLEELILKADKICTLEKHYAPARPGFLYKVLGYEPSCGCCKKRLEILVSGNTQALALYALTHKLVAEGVLSKEEVKEALTNV